jgi:hypothetical protein
MPNFDFKECQFKNLVGRASRGYCPPATPVRGALPAVMEVAEFAGTLKACEFRAVDTAADQVAAEGAPFWLCRLVEDAFQAATPISFAGEAFDIGFYLVKIQWLEYIDFDAVSGRRRYRLSADERMISVHSLIRGHPIKLAKADAPPARGRPPSNPIQFFYLSKEECGRIIDCAEIQDYDIE